MSDDVAIRVKNLGKRYKLGQQTGGYKTLGETISNAVKSPFKRLQQRKSSEEKEEAGTFWALKDVSFEVKKGEAIGIIGRNGAGKSTLLKILSRITSPTEGKVEITGRIGALLEVGTGFHPELTGRENIFLTGSILGMRKTEIEEKFDDIVKFAGIEQFLDTPVKRYSSGMYVRLGFAVAAHLEPDILVVDEVLAVGDADFQKKCLGKMGEVAKGGRTVLFVSHNMNAIDQLCTSVILLEKGNIVEYSRDKRAVISRYLGNEGDNAYPSEWKNKFNEYDNPWFKPLSFFISDNNSVKITESVSNNDDLWLNIVGETKEIDIALQVGCAFYDEDGVLLFWSYQNDVEESKWPIIKCGISTYKTKIPKRLFNQGIIRIDLMISLYYREWICEPNINSPSIFLNIQGGLSDSPYWALKRSGIIAPVLEWTNDICSSD